MKKLKKLMALALALVMATALAVVPAQAAGTGIITIDNAYFGATYEIYKLFDVEYPDADSDGSPDSTSFVYTITDTTSDNDWYAFVSTAYYDANSNGTQDSGEEYVSLTAIPGKTDQYYVTSVMLDTTTASAFAIAANEYAEAKNIAADGVATATSSTVTFNNLDLGYYLVDSGAGVMCSLNTTIPSATIEEKNELPNIEKKVNGSPTDHAYFGETLTYTLTVNADIGAQNYCLVDTLPAGITNPTVTGVTFNGTNLELKVDNTLNGYTTETTVNGDNTTTLTIDLTGYCLHNSIKNGDSFVVTYTATLNNNAVIAGTGNTNNVTLYYGSDSSDDTDTLGDLTKDASATVYTYQLDVTKVDADENTKKLQGAEFILYYTDGSTTKYAQVTDGKLTGWTETKADATTLTTDSNGAITVKGLGDATYTLEETKAPAGYQLPSDTTTDVIITNANVPVTVENSTGSKLPETGGVGTTIFYTVGGILVLAALVLLVSKKRVQE